MPSPPRWLLRIAWPLQRGLYTLSGGRLGLEPAGSERLGTLRLRTIGRRSGEERPTMLYYLEDGDRLAVVASNAGAADDPGWWRNLQAEPLAWVDLPDGSRRVRARSAEEAERERLWERFTSLFDGYERYAAAAGRPIPIVILEPADESSDA